MNIRKDAMRRIFGGARPTITPYDPLAPGVRMAHRVEVGGIGPDWNRAERFATDQAKSLWRLSGYTRSVFPEERWINWVQSTIHELWASGVGYQGFIQGTMDLIYTFLSELDPAFDPLYSPYKQ